jgi:hypothetical protein
VFVFGGAFFATRRASPPWPTRLTMLKLWQWGRVI